MHMAAVNPDSSDTPIRAFGTFTHDLHDLADGWHDIDGTPRRGLRQLGYRVVQGDPAHPPRAGQVALDVVPGAHHEQKAWAAVLPDFLRWAFPPPG